MSEQPSNALSPDLDWSQVRETVRMLFLNVAQIEIALKESDASVLSLTDAFTEMIAYESVIKMAVDDLPQTDETKIIRQTISTNADKVTNSMQNAIVAFQFYDKLTQRLSHVSHSVEALSDIVSDQSKIYNPYEWKMVQQKIKSKYSMREEVEMFDNVMAGANVRDAIHAFNEAQKEVGMVDDIEFF
ncbi:MAG: hypothetical protein ISR69_05025 [Gammaproteobacteria bacterium]|nr:hypothetical protein [Gammaproteobacteria bacterium]